jgi:hypothetical protein
MRCSSSRLATNCELPCRGATPGRGIIARVGGFYSRSVRARFNGCGLVETLSRFSVAEVEKQLPMARAVCLPRAKTRMARGCPSARAVRHFSIARSSRPSGVNASGPLRTIGQRHCFAVCSLLQDQSPTRCDQSQFKLGSEEEGRPVRKFSRVDQRIARSVCAGAVQFSRIFRSLCCSASSAGVRATALAASTMNAFASGLCSSWPAYPLPPD